MFISTKSQTLATSRTVVSSSSTAGALRSWSSGQTEHSRRGPAAAVRVRGWGLFDVDGRWLGSLSLPPRFRLTDVEEDRILGVWRDELDVERVREYQLVGTAR